LHFAPHNESSLLSLCSPHPWRMPSCTMIGGAVDLLVLSVPSAAVDLPHPPCLQRRWTFRILPAFSGGGLSVSSLPIDDRFCCRLLSPEPSRPGQHLVCPPIAKLPTACPEGRAAATASCRFYLTHATSIVAKATSPTTSSDPAARAHTISQQPVGLLAASPSERSTPAASFMSKRSRFITFVHAFAKSATKSFLASSHA